MEEEAYYGFVSLCFLIILATCIYCVYLAVYRHTREQIVVIPPIRIEVVLHTPNPLLSHTEPRVEFQPTKTRNEHILPASESA